MINGINGFEFEKIQKFWDLPPDKELMAKKKKLPVSCFRCNKATGKWLNEDSPKLHKTECDTCKEAKNVNASLENEIIIKHLGEADNQLNDVGQELLGCSRCDVDSLDDCSCCTFCHLPPTHHHNHEYIPKGKNVRDQLDAAKAI